MKTGEAVVEVGKSLTPISEFKPARLTANFAKNFFKAKAVPGTRASAIVKGKSRGNQQTFLDDLCIRLPVLEYQTLSNSGKLTGKVKTKGKPTDCVSFQARNAQLLVELSWTSFDDLDLSVIQPDGVLSRSRKKSSQGGVFILDTRAKVCATGNPVGKEVVPYKNKSTVPPGKYTVQIRHFENCGDGPTAWNLRVSVNGKQIPSQMGKSNSDDDTLISTASFKI